MAGFNYGSDARKVQKTTLLSAAIVTGAGTAQDQFTKDVTFHVTGLTTAGAGAATVDIEATLNDVDYFTLATVTLTLGTTVVDDGFALSARYSKLRANVTAISGTNASVTVTMGQ